MKFEPDSDFAQKCYRVFVTPFPNNADYSRLVQSY
jgi:hypothetical protein